MRAVGSMAVACALALGAAGASAQNKWGAHIDVEGKLGSKRHLGELDLFVPLLQDQGSLLFGNLRGRLDDSDNKEWNAGLGYRRMVGSWNFGGYGYLDRRRSDLGNDFSQLTFGGEALGRDWDFRANAYLPTGTRIRPVDTTNTASISGTTVLVSSVTRDERALKGFDIEAGWRVPLSDADGPWQLRVYAGAYRFKDSRATVSGPRLRAELEVAELSQAWPGARLLAGAEVQDDQVRGGQTFLTLRLRIPLDGEKGPGHKLSRQERRMTAPVVRDVDIVAPLVARPAIVEAATSLADGRAFTVLNSETTTGAALPGAVTAAGAGSVVVLSGTFNTTATTTLQSGQTLAGAVTVRTASGLTATTPSATIAGSFSGVAVDAANNSTIRGLNIRNTGAAGTGTSGIRVNGATGVTIANNTITASELGTNSSNGIVLTGTSSATITGNTVSAVGNNNAGVATAINVFSATSTVTISGNVLSGSGSSTAGFNRYLSFGAGATVNSASSTGNVATAGTCNNLGANGSVSFTNGTTCP